MKLEEPRRTRSGGDDTSPGVDRREFLRTAALVTTGLALAPTLADALSAGAAPATWPPGVFRQARAGEPYGPLQPPDANGIRLPRGFTSRIIATTEQPVAGSQYRWHYSPDGGACFPAPDGTRDYVYVSNSETIGSAGGGVSAVRFAYDGRILGAYRILADTHINCAGGGTPWGTWLSGEEHGNGQVWECDPFRASQGVARNALGVFTHEAAAVDPIDEHVYLTEDRPDGRLYRFVPAAYPDLTRGRLEVAAVGTPRGSWAPVEWIVVSDGTVGASSPRPAGSTNFVGGEGIFWHHGAIYFTTKGDNRVWKLDTRRQRLTIVYDDAFVAGAPLTGVDNVVVTRANEVIVAEDGADMQLVLLRPGEVVGPLLQVVDQEGSELCGPAFSPRGDRLYFSSQRALGIPEILHGLGITYEVSGPFRGRRRN
jgi:secreted PhoX family phosphatase